MKKILILELHLADAEIPFETGDEDENGLYSKVGEGKLSGNWSLKELEGLIASADEVFACDSLITRASFRKY